MNHVIGSKKWHLLLKTEKTDPTWNHYESQKRRYLSALAEALQAKPEDKNAGEALTTNLDKTAKEKVVSVANEMTEKVKASSRIVIQRPFLGQHQQKKETLQTLEAVTDTQGKSSDSKTAKDTLNQNSAILN